MRSVTMLAVALLLGACGSGATVAPDADLGCEGTPPELDDCPRGYFFAECGGLGAPRLACRVDDAGVDDCYWFTGGCVARGFTPSDCGADDICCHVVEGYNAEKFWPYEGSEGAGFEYLLSDRIYGFGDQPWDRARDMALDVAVDPSLVSAPTTWTCEGEQQVLSSGRSPCGLPTETSATLSATLSVVSQYRGFYGWNPLVEIDLEAGTARLCAYFYTDIGGPVCTTYGAKCADQGTITISRTPASRDDLAGLVMTVDVSFDSGAYVFRGTTTVGR